MNLVQSKSNAKTIYWTSPITTLDGSDSSNESEKNSHEILDPLLQEEAQLYEVDDDYSDQEDSTPISNISNDRDFGKFERHTKGIGLKLMQKMCYKVVLEQRDMVLQNQLRQRYGLRKWDWPTAVSMKNDPIKEGYKKKKSAKSRKLNVEYKTADEIMSDIASVTPIQSMKIIDMTGPQARELLSASQITSLTIPDSSTRLPELRHNLRLIVDMSKLDLEYYTRERGIQNERSKALERDVDRISTLLEDETERINRLNDIISIVKECNRLLTLTISSNSPSLQLFMDPFEKLQTKYQEEYILYNLDVAVITIIATVFKQYMTFWDPLENSKLGLHEFSEMERELSMTPYESMMYNIWLPKVRSAINNTWYTRDFDPEINLLKNWRPPLLPVFIYENIINQLIMPKLTREVDAWNPKTDIEMIYQWLHSWLPLLDTKAMNICIRGKKLSEIIRTRFQINPIKQELGLFNCVMTWRHMFTSEIFGRLFETAFFPKCVPPEMLSDLIIETQFIKGLNMINESISLVPAGRLKHPSQQSEVPDSDQLFSSTNYAPIIDDDEITFKEIVKEFAEEHNLLFIPTNKIHQVIRMALYRIGRTTQGLIMYLDDNRKISYLSQPPRRGVFLGWEADPELGRREKDVTQSTENE
ncbi:8742_t:CDS:10 [Scutellospora calospora]|uniref:8742_t:CDS:1 n=1 Tax=Scutellospora calospora TaxID=85575 RepID=A0ACA9JTZ3_9GLOM|nr:8742_t:CDS:10 [Scutellospora calospora]